MVNLFSSTIRGTTARVGAPSKGYFPTENFSLRRRDLFGSRKLEKTGKCIMPEALKLYLFRNEKLCQDYFIGKVRASTRISILLRNLLSHF